jgi:hypothetical protein
MSLMNLLSMGQSFEGADQRRGAYRLRVKSALPKFAPAKRPVSLAPAQTTKKAGNDSGKTVAAAKVELAAVVECKQKQNPTTMKSLMTKAAAKTSSLMGDNVRALKKTISEMFSSGQSRRKAANPAVQPELLLEKVKPLRNDLSDADLEVVEQKLNLTLPDREVARAGWTRHTVRFLNPKTGYEVEKDIGVQKNPDVIEIKSPADLAEFVERERTAELVEQA